MNNEIIKSIAKSIFSVVKEGVIMDIEVYLDDAIINSTITKNDEMYSNLVENHDRIIAYYDDYYLKTLIFEYLSNVIIEEEDVLVFGSYYDSSIQQVIFTILERIEKIGWPMFITSKYFEEQDQTFDIVACNFANCIKGKYYADLAFRNIFSHWVLEKGYLNEAECKRSDKQYIEEYYFNDFMDSHIHFLDLLNHSIEIERVENHHLENDYPHLI